MAKFNITIDLDWIEEDYSLDEHIKEELIFKIVSTLQEKLIGQIEQECTNKLNEQMTAIDIKINSKLNDIMDSFLNEPKDITDKYGDVVAKNVSVKDTLKKACDAFLTQPLDEYGKPAQNSWSTKYQTRVDYFVAKTIDSNMTYNIERAVEEIKKQIEAKIKAEVKSQIGNKIANAIGLEDIFKN